MRLTPLFSVVIPTYHRNDLLAKCLDCLKPEVQTLATDQYEVIVTDDDRVTILLGGYHPTNWITTYPLHVFVFDQSKSLEGYPAKKGDVTIGHDVWVATGATILCGTSQLKKLGKKLHYSQPMTFPSSLKNTVMKTIPYPAI